ncbi:MAG: 2-C-methyl-D-erythritol 4-phosphate cytidylyltransferase [Firmicutes bacterium]|nr:2-C-methyl-D-erythritol 4-phosphate cytidylyltransferase [Bacillota bacterium]
MYKDKRVSVVIPAAGMGKRMKSKKNKQYLLLQGKPVLAHTINKFNKCKLIDEIIVVTRENEIEYCKENIVKKYDFNKVSKVIKGGKERFHSVYNGLKSVDENTDILLIHDGARPFITGKTIEKCIVNVNEYKACILGVPVKDTIKEVNEDKSIINTPDRSRLWAVQTPQCFEYDLILNAYNSDINKENITDDSMLLERLGYEVKIILGDYNNIKLTTPEDMEFAKAILKK